LSMKKKIITEKAGWEGVWADWHYAVPVRPFSALPAIMPLFLFGD